MNKRLAITAQKAIGKGKLLWLDCYNDAIYQDIAPTIKTNYYQEQMHFLMEQGEINEIQIPQQDYPKMKTDKMLNVITLFSGYDSQCLALNRLGLPYDLVAWAEIDKHACTAHDALFPQFKGRNVGDVSRVDWAEWHRQHPQPIDLLTYSSPCQDFSSAGLQRGGEEGSGTRSGLLWETERAVSELRPRCLVFENVGGLVSDKFIDLFQRWQVRLNGYGYTNFAQLMNAKDYGVPQNRLRIFMVSILDCPRAYYFPQPFRLERRLKDVLEQNVAERYYLKEEQVYGLWKNLKPYDCFYYNQSPDFTRPPLENMGRTVKADSHTPAVAEPQMLGWTRNERGEITDRHPVSVANCVTAAKRDNTQNYVMEPSVIELPVEKSHQQDAIQHEDGISRCLVVGSHGNSAFFTNTLVSTPQGIRIRRLTERELYRLMDVDEKDIDTLLAAPIPRTQHAKLAGNSIVVACLYYIFRNLFVDTEPAAGTQTKLF